MPDSATPERLSADFCASHAYRLYTLPPRSTRLSYRERNEGLKCSRPTAKAVIPRRLQASPPAALPRYVPPTLLEIYRSYHSAKACQTFKSPGRHAACFRESGHFANSCKQLPQAFAKRNCSRIVASNYHRAVTAFGAFVLPHPSTTSKGNEGNGGERAHDFHCGLAILRNGRMWLLCVPPFGSCVAARKAAGSGGCASRLPPWNCHSFALPVSHCPRPRSPCRSAFVAFVRPAPRLSAGGFFIDVIEHMCYYIRVLFLVSLCVFLLSEICVPAQGNG